MIVAFQGRKRAGKNEAAHRLASVASPQGFDVEFRAFADPLKDTLCRMFGVDRATLDRLKDDPEATVVLWDGNDDSIHFTARQLHQRFGEAAREYFGHDLWLDLCLPLDFQHEDRLVIITDVRPAFEVERVQALGGFVVRLDGGEEFDGHSTEVMGGEPDYVIDNTSHDLAILDAALVRLWWWLCCGSPRLAQSLPVDQLSLLATESEPHE